MRRAIGWILAALAVAAVIFLAYGSWRTYAITDRILTVGGNTAQNSGWPAPETAADIGYVGNPQQAYGYAFEDVAIATELGDAPAWLVRPTSSSSTWAIIVHGIGGRRENGYRFLPTFRNAGLPTLLISYRNDDGAPLSPDHRYAFGLTEWRDLDAAVTYALANGADDVVLLGESMGGGIVGQFLRQSQHADRVKAIVLDAPAIDFSATVLDQMRQLDIPLAGVLLRGGLTLGAWRMPFDLRQANVMAEYAGFAGPLFLSHGSADRIVPIGVSDDLVARRTAPTEYLRTGADHIQSWKEDPARYDAALLAFLRTIP